ncbi:peptide chain release factor N(5)-glutamine methyltransferase [Gammaproteobacteria bacterium]|nr:peptide chain release factor N(5)-glutamine methyltransferase [Gammaproteobacteria bacterium]MDA9269017.1 peptide chain release factor N(5)-glutamine methyltransferase [Gammaproteobacteria bacterium]MDB9901236.1 peptide chain release factor N(5)-glutamine methyltransferase [Gammaproteobacteria bacterium]MDC1277251.1 peptide chain release factor N(5)-glutamine methyltransferase [Gammaproteobacteria bacterium]
MNLSLKFYFDQAQKLSFVHKEIVRDFGYFLNAIGIASIAIALKDDLEVSKEQLASVDSFFTNYAKGVPLDYILNESSFLDFTFYVDSRVLIPRPETELIVEKVIDFALNKNANVLDVGTGSGCISISLAMLRPDLKIFASDISLDALDVASINLQNYQVKNVLLIQSNWLSYVKTKSVDLVISNPPYLKPDDIHLENLIHEPQSALVSPKGIKSFLEISHQAFIALKHGGRIIFEHGHSQRLEVTEILEDCGFTNIISEPDLQGLDRFIYAQKL